MAAIDEITKERCKTVIAQFEEDGIAATPVAVQDTDGTIIHLVATRDEKRAAAIQAGRPYRQKASEFAIIGPREWIVDDLIPAGAGLVLLYGESTAGKSYWLLDLVTAIARGVQWRNKDTRRTPVLQIVAEGARDYKFRIQALAKILQCKLDELPDIYAAAPDLLDNEQFKQLLGEIQAGEIVTIDTLNATMLADENSSEAMGRYISRCKQINEKTGKPVIILHHPGKNLSLGARGHSSLRAAVDVELTIIKQGAQRCAAVSKLKDGVDGDKYPFVLESVELGIDARGKSYGAAVVKHNYKNAIAAALAEPKGTVAKLILKVARDEMHAGTTMDRAKLIEQVEPMLDGKRRSYRIDRAITTLITSGHLHDAGNRCVSLTRAVENKDEPNNWE